MPVEIECGTGVPPVSLESAGGIGGLLGIHDADATPGPAGGDGNYAVLCDANGNVTQLVAWASTVQDDSATALGNAWDANRIAAHYEYDPYGNVINDLGGQVYAAENPWRFSTKPFDAETGLGYWGYRYYSPTLGRWMNRDPIGEDGGVALYILAANVPNGRYDRLGQFAMPPIDNMDKITFRCWGPTGFLAPEQGPDWSGPMHCGFTCEPAGGGASAEFDGTGPRSRDVPPGGIGGNGHPGLRVFDGLTEITTAPGGTRYVPGGTCDCLRKAARALNDISGKTYGWITSNSNGAANCILQACGVQASPSQIAPGWHDVIWADCGDCKNGILKCPVDCTSLLDEGEDGDGGDDGSGGDGDGGGGDNKCTPNPPC
jgi:RHS repeat-associated protein